MYHIALECWRSYGFEKLTLKYQHFASGFPAASFMAYYALVKPAQLEAGEWVLIHSAMGGVGHIAKRKGTNLYYWLAIMSSFREDDHILRS